MAEQASFRSARARREWLAVAVEFTENQVALPKSGLRHPDFQEPAWYSEIAPHILRIDLPALAHITPGQVVPGWKWIIERHESSMPPFCESPDTRFFAEETTGLAGLGGELDLLPGRD